MNALELGALEERQISWQAAHEALSRLARARAAADAEEGRWLLAAERAAVHVHLGYGSFREYIERLFGYRPRSLQEKLRVAEALEGMPALAQALSSGELSWSAARELTRVAVRDTEQEWLQFARGKTLRQLEQVLAYQRPGDTPASPPDLSAQRHTLRFEVAADTLALFREARSELRRRAGAPLDDDSALLELARCVLGGPRDEGRASYQVVLNVCPACGNGRQQAAGELVPVDPDVVNMAQCDAQHVSLEAGPIAGPSETPANDRELNAERGEVAATSEPATDRGAHVGTSTRPSVGSLDEQSAQRSSGSSAAGRAVTNRALQTNVAADATGVLPRAKQTIPPALHRAVLLRAQHRCQVPGCSNARWVDVHHLRLRSEGGRHSLQNLLCLCGAHHRAVHHGQLELERSESGALCVRHADGTEYGGLLRPHLLELRAKVFSALRQLGFREAQVRAALEPLPEEPGGAQVSFDGLLRAALARLRSPGAQRKRAQAHSLAFHFLRR